MLIEQSIWPVTELVNIIYDMQPGFARRPNAADEGIAQLRTNNVSNEGNIYLAEIKHVNASEAEIEKYGVQKGDVIFNNTNSPELVGRAAFFNEDAQFVLSNHMTRLRVNPKLIDAEFLARYINYLWQIGASSRWAKHWVNQAAIDQVALERFEIPLPPLPEQQRIVTILRKADELRQLRRTANARAQELLPALFHEMFGKHWHSWPQGKIGDVIDLETGKSISAHPFPAGEDKWGILKVSAVTLGEFRQEENKELPTDAVFDSYLEVHHGDLLISRANTLELVGASALVYNPPSKLILPDKLWRAVIKGNENTNAAFLHALFNSPAIRSEISRRASGTSDSMKNISQEKFLNIDIPIPPPLEQYRFGQLSERFRSQIVTDQNNSTGKAESLYGSLLTHAFTGELTATWREAHAAELAAAAAERDRLLGEAVSVRPEAATAHAEATGPVVKSTPARAVAADLDAHARQLLQAAQSRPAYFRPADLVNGDGLTAVQAEAGLHLLAALGFVRQVELAGQLLYRAVDAIGESAAKPAALGEAAG